MSPRPPESLPTRSLPTGPSYGIVFSPSQAAVSPLQGVKHEPQTIEWIWRLFNTLPKARPQLRNSQEAAARLLTWRSKSRLPPRRAYLSTVDYYEACIPLLTARRRVMAFDDTPMMGVVTQACRSVVPKNLF